MIDCLALCFWQQARPSFTVPMARCAAPASTHPSLSPCCLFSSFAAPAFFILLVRSQETLDVFQETIRAPTPFQAVSDIIPDNGSSTAIYADEASASRRKPLNPINLTNVIDSIGIVSI